MGPIATHPLVITDRDPRHDADLLRAVERHPGLECVVVTQPSDVPSASCRVTRALLAGRAVRLRSRDAGGLTASVIEAGRDAAGLTIGTLVDRADEWLDNIAIALPRLVELPGANVLEGAWPGRPALVVGAGPSLDAIDDVALSRLASCAVLFATGSALEPLARRGIEADVAVVIEGADCSAQFSAPVCARRTILALAQHGHPAHLAMGECAGRVRLDMAENSWFAELAGSAAIVPSTGNSGAAALGLALRAGCGPIVLAGLDFALTDEGGHHAAGSASGPFGRAGGRSGSADAVGGGRVFTSALLGAYRAGVESIVAAAECDVINLDPGRKARIRGTRELDPDDALRSALAAHPRPGAAPHPADARTTARRGPVAERGRAILDGLARFEGSVRASAGTAMSDDALRAQVAGALVDRRGSLEAALFHGHVLDPRRGAREVLGERLLRAQEYRAFLSRRIASLSARDVPA